MSKIVPFLWYSDKAAEAAAFYVSLLPDSRIDNVWTLPADSPSGPPGSVEVIDFTLAGRPFTAMKAGPLDSFNHAISFVVNCADQAEIDRLWEALPEGGSTEACGWLKDRYGVWWQIVPTILLEMMRDPDRGRAKRAAEAMLEMTKISIADLQKAFAVR